VVPLGGTKCNQNNGSFLAMRMLYLTPPSSRNGQADLQSDSVVEIIAALSRGTVLAGRYKILETIDAETFKGHDLALDQTVMVRRASLKIQEVAEFWYRKVQQLALKGDRHPLNVLAAVSENGNDFNITEWPRGGTVGDLFREESSLPRMKGSGALPKIALTNGKNSVPFTQTREVIRRFNRDTGWVATAVMAVVISGAVGLAMQIKEHHLKAEHPDNSVAFFNDVERTSGQSSGQITSVRIHDIDLALTKTSSPVDPSLQMETTAPRSLMIPVFAFTKNPDEGKPNPRSWAAIHRSQSRRQMPLKIPAARSRSVGRSNIVDMKKTLVALWRASLVREDRTGGLEYPRQLEDQR
jgi:hypothetical protein